MKKLTEYPAIIVDLDGTLYFQRPVRLAMLFDMALHFWQFPDFLIVRKYRKLYENGCNEAQRLEQLPEKAVAIVERWMLQRPLKYIAKYQDDRLIDILERTRQSGTTVIVYSDYPVKDKLSALAFKPDYALSADDTGCMKPDARGLCHFLASQGINPKECLVIGDREDKDGILAANMRAESIVLPARKANRRVLYKVME